MFHLESRLQDLWLTFCNFPSIEQSLEMRWNFRKTQWVQDRCRAFRASRHTLLELWNYVCFCWQRRAGLGEILWQDHQQVWDNESASCLPSTGALEYVISSHLILKVSMSVRGYYTDGEEKMSPKGPKFTGLLYIYIRIWIHVKYFQLHYFTEKAGRQNKWHVTHVGNGGSRKSLVPTSEFPFLPWVARESEMNPNSD